MTITRFGRQSLYKYLALMTATIIVVPTIIVLIQGLIEKIPLNPSFNLTSKDYLEALTHILGQLIAGYFLGAFAARQIIIKKKNHFFIGISTVFMCWCIFFLIVLTFDHFKNIQKYPDRAFVDSLGIMYILSYSLIPSILFGALFGKHIKKHNLPANRQ